MDDMMMNRVSNSARVSAVFMALVDTLEEFLKNDTLKKHLNSIGAKTAFAEMFFKEYLDDEELTMNNLTDEKIKKRANRFKNEFCGIMMKWILNEKDSSFMSTVKMVTELKELLVNIDKDLISDEVGKPVDHVHTHEEIKDLLQNETFCDLHRNDIRCATLDFIAFTLPRFKDQAEKEGKPLADVVLKSIMDTSGKFGFQIDNDTEYYRNIIERIQNLPTEEMQKAIQNIIIGLKKKNDVRTLEDAFNVAGLAALLTTIAKDPKGMIPDKETFKGVSTLAIRRQIKTLPKEVVLKLGSLCMNYYNDFTEEGKQKFINDIDEYVHSISGGGKELLKNTFLDSIASGKGAMVIDETGDIGDITNKILESLNEDDDEDEDDEEE